MQYCYIKKIIQKSISIFDRVLAVLMLYLKGCMMHLVRKLHTNNGNDAEYKLSKLNENPHKLRRLNDAMAWPVKNGKWASKN